MQVHPSYSSGWPSPSQAHQASYSSFYPQTAYYPPSYYMPPRQPAIKPPLPKPFTDTPPTQLSEAVKEPDKPKVDTTLFDRFNIHPDDVIVDAPHSVQETIEKNKASLLQELLTLHRAAKLDHRSKPNASNYHFRSKVVLSHGVSATARNHEVARDETTSADYLATMKALDRSKRAKNKVQLVLLADSRKSFPMLHPSEELREWMSLAGHQNFYSPFTPNTMVVNLTWCPKTGQHTLKVRQVKDLIVPIDTLEPSITNKRIKKLPLEISVQATATMKEKRIKEKQLRLLAQKAKSAYAQRKKLFPDESIESAAVQLGKHVYTATNTKWSPRIVERPGVTAASYGIHDREQQMKTSWLRRLFFGKPTSPEIDAIAYYGDDPRYPLPTTMSKFSRQNKGKGNTLVLTLKNDTLHVSTVKEHKSIPEKV